MLIKQTELPLTILRQDQPKRWKDGMARLQVDQLYNKTRPGTFLRKQLVASLAIADSLENNSTKGRSRGYDSYNSIFKPYLQQDILELLCEIAQSHKNRPIRILDDGAGNGNFLHGIKLKLAERGITARTTATSLTLDDQIKTRNIDVAYEGPSGMFVPEEKQDFIVSVMGTLWYLPSGLNKELILKHAYSLVKGGYLLLTTCGVSPNVFKDDPKMQKVDEVYKCIRQSLEKRGFEVIHASDVGGCGILIVKRLN